MEHQFSTVHILDDLRLTSIKRMRREFQQTVYDSVILMPCLSPFYNNETVIFDKNFGATQV